MLLRAAYNTNDELNEFVDIYYMLVVGRGKHMGKEKKCLLATIHVDTLDNDRITEILDEGGTPEFDFSDLPVVDIRDDD